MGGGAFAQGKTYTFALVPKNTNNPFFDQAQAGCKKAEAEPKGAIECLYIGRANTAAATRKCRSSPT